MFSSNYQNFLTFCVSQKLDVWPITWKHQQNFQFPSANLKNAGKISIILGHTDSESAQHFWLRKTHKSFLCSRQGLNLMSSNLGSDALPTELPKETKTNFNKQNNNKTKISPSDWHIYDIIHKSSVFILINNLFPAFILLGVATITIYRLLCYLQICTIFVCTGR